MDTQVNRFRRLTAAILILFLTVFVAAACTAAAKPQPTLDPATPAAALQMTEDAMRLQAHQTSTAEKAAFSQQQTSIVQTQTAQATSTSPATATATPSPTAAPDVQSTQQYEAMFAKVKQYAKDGYLSSTNGTYHKLPDYVDNWAQIDYYRWYPTGYSPKNFMIEADIEYASDSPTANWFESGCGFTFHVQDVDNHYAIFMMMDGYSRSSAFSAGYYYKMGEGYYGKMDIPTGKVHIALTVNGRDYALFTNGKLTKKYQGMLGKLTTGGLAYTMSSGTNVGFGTSCKFTNTELWVVND